MPNLLVLSVVLTWVQHKLVPTYKSPWCGLGALKIMSDISRSAPMAYRVLGLPFVNYYHWFKFAGIVWALWNVKYALGETAMFYTAAILPITFWYDYWDWSFELAGLMAAISGNLALAIVAGALWALSRETAPISPLMYFYNAHDWAGTITIAAVIGGIMLVVRLVQGKRDLYCDRFMTRVNLELLLARNPRAWISLALAIIASVGIIARGQYPALAIVVAGLTMAKLDETRVFASVIPLAVML